MSDFIGDAQALTEAAERHDRLAAWDAAGRLVSHLSNLDTKLSAQTIRHVVWSGAAQYRWFDIAEVLAGAAAARSDAPPATRRLHGQMLLERGYTEEALSRLSAVIADPALLPVDRAEAYGHIGRIHKDRFVSAAAGGDETGARASLRLAIDAYTQGRDVNDLDRSRAAWLGINAAALLARPEAVMLAVDAAEQARRLAHQVQADLAALPGDLYAKATAAEALLVLGDIGTAVPLVREYAFDAGVNGFAMNNFHRQLTTVWRLQHRPTPGPEILAVVAAAMMEKNGAAVQVSRQQVQRVGGVDYQAVFGADRFLSLENYRRGLDRCACVARIGRAADTGVGSGFVVPARQLCDVLDDRYVLVTNAHVISKDTAEREQGALHPDEAVVTFAALENVPADREFGISRLLFSSPRTALDVVVAELQQPIAPGTPYPLSAVLPVAASQASVRVIGHPSGRGLSFSMNQLLDHEAPKVHYSTATEGGSSGSPVFNQEWKLIGLHHAGGDAVPRLNGKPGTYQANEGIWIQAICTALAQAKATLG